MNILSVDERAALLKGLSKAPDEILLDAVRRLKEWRVNIQRDMKELSSFVGIRVSEAPPARPAASAPLPPPVSSPPSTSEAAPRINKSPGNPGITKIGTKTKDEILAVLKAGRQPNHDKYGEHLKLLWSRGEIKFDGSTYYL